ncbi:hypothetical protein NHP200010_15050 [Helicobacter bizzozeronii]|nr:hypothetical protein [Helicobacter bizzozeronii]GMB93774.1 hypothetical protein NHP200010_15050 [Helicobacter bizzozeronii]
MQTYPHDSKLDTSLKQALSYQLFPSLSDLYIDWVFDVDQLETPKNP